MTDVTILHPPNAPLCAGCKAFKWPAVPFPDKEGEKCPITPPHPTFRKLQESADEGCILCQFLWSALVCHSKISRQTVTEYLEKGLSLTSDLRLDGSFGMGLCVHLRDEAAAVKDERFMRFPVIDGEMTKSLKDVEPRHIKCFAPDSMPDELDDLIKDTIQPWMKRCREQHEDHDKCGPSDGVRILPTRLVDVGTSETDSIKVITTSNSEMSIDSPYLILSYCWGKGNASAMTTMHNVEERSRGFSVAGLPPTLQDAITVTRRLGFQYLWIDAMCIIQATDNHAGDFATEATKMGDYYTNAECCIAASLASDSAQGFLTKRVLGRYPIQPVAIQLSSSSPNSHGDDENNKVEKGPESVIMLATESSSKLSYVLNNSPLMSRGWYLQELMLSRRILHWTQHGLFLQCRSSIFIEGQVGKWTGDPSSFSPRDILALPKENAISYDGWYKLLQNFSRKKLTFESDRMYAIQGLAAQLVQRLAVEYSYGLFRPHLAQGLMWYTYGQKQPPPPVDMRSEHADSKVSEERMEKPLFPSWCWASNCPVGFISIHGSAVFIRDDHPRRPRQFPTHPGHLGLDHADDKTDAGALYLRAPLLRVECTRTTGPENAVTIAITDKNKHKYKDKDNNGTGRKWILEGSAWWFQDKQLQVDDICPSQTQISSSEKAAESIVVTWLLVGALKRKSSVVCSYTGLLVHKTPDEKEEETYRRYALLAVNFPSERMDVRIEDCYDGLTEIVLR